MLCFTIRLAHGVETELYRYVDIAFGAVLFDLRDLPVAQEHIADGEIAVGALGVGVDDVLGISELFGDCYYPGIEI